MPPTKDRSWKKQGRRLFLSFSNLSRSLFVSFFGLVLNYILLRFKSHLILDSYVYCMTLVNVLMVFSNWGAKDYLIRQLSENTSQLKTILNNFFNSKLVLLAVLAVFIAVLPATPSQKLFMFVYLFLRTFISSLEPLIIFRKKFQTVLLVDSILSLILLLLVYFDHNTSNPTLFFKEVLIIESLRCLAFGILFKEHLAFAPDFRGALKVIFDSRFFFFTALAGFLCSRADQYVVALLLSKSELSHYYILMNLVILCQTAYTTFISTFSSNIFRYAEASFNKFMKFTSWLGLGLSFLSTLIVYIFCSYYYNILLNASFIGFIFITIFSFSLVLLQVYHYTRLNRQKEIFKVIAFSGLINILGSFILVPQLGVLGALIGNTLCAIVTFVFLKIYSKNLQKTRG